MIDDKGKIKGLPKCANPDCRKILNGFTGLDGDNPPKEGDISICAYCAEVMEFDFEHHPVTMQLLTYNSLPQELKTQIDKAQQAVIWNLEKKH